MQLVKFSFFCLVFLVGCGVNEAQLKSLTDTKSVLMYQHVEADSFRLLACPYKVDLDIANDCSNVFSTAKGKEYYFSGVPKQPLLFAPSQESVERFLTVPIIVGGAVLSWFLLNKLRGKHVYEKAVKELDVRLNIRKAAARQADAAPKVNTAPPQPDAAVAAQAAKQTEKITQKSYRELAATLETAHKKYHNLFEYPQRITPNKVSKGNDAVDGIIDSTFSESNSDIFRKIEDEKAFMAEQFAAIKESIDDTIFNNLRFKGGILKRQPPKPSKIFNDFQAMYDEGIAAMQNSYKETGEFSLEQSNNIMKDLRKINDGIIDEFLGKFTPLVKQSDEQADIFAKIKQRQSDFRAKTATAEKAVMEGNTVDAANDISEGMRGIAGAVDFLIVGIGGLLAGSYLPDKIPALEARLFTKKEWQKLFVRDDSFKNPLRIPDSYRVVEKVARYLKRKGEKVVINEKVFFGLKN